MTMRTLPRRSRFVPAAGALGLAVVALDALTKQLAETHLGSPVELAIGAQLSLSYNSGVAFGALSGAPDALVVAAVSACVAALMTALVRGWLAASALAVGLLVGGAVANLVDRAPDGRVTDFIDLPRWPAFNVADVAIAVAVLALVAGSVRADASRKPATPTP